MKKVLSHLASLLGSFLLGIFAVALIGHAIKGDVFAIILAVSEFILMAFPFVCDEGKMSKMVSRIWYYCLYGWFAAAIIWSLIQLNLF